MHKEFNQDPDISHHPNHLPQLPKQPKMVEDLPVRGAAAAAVVVVVVVVVAATNHHHRQDHHRISAASQGCSLIQGVGQVDHHQVDRKHVTNMKVMEEKLARNTV